jgi:hypothetical protein
MILNEFDIKCIKSLVFKSHKILKKMKKKIESKRENNTSNYNK